MWVVWLDNREIKQLARLELRIAYAPQDCPADRPLQLKMNNGNNVPLTELRWRIAAYAPGDTVNLADNQYSAPRYRGPGELQGRWQLGRLFAIAATAPRLSPANPGFSRRTLAGQFLRLIHSPSFCTRNAPCPLR
jgi:hypothetical protein